MVRISHPFLFSVVLWPATGFAPLAVAYFRTRRQVVLRTSLSTKLSLANNKEVPLGTHEIKEETQSAKFSWEKQWYPVLPLSYLEEPEDPSQPVGIHVLGRSLVVWKNGKTFSVMEDICPHRKSALSTGQVVAGCRLQCRYHGYEFDAEGQCVKIPMQTTAKYEDHDGDKKSGQSGITATTFPSQLAGGILWVYLGSTNNDDPNDDFLPPIPASAIPSAEETDGASWMFNRNPISYVSMMENTFDPAHAPFTHQGMVGYGGMVFSPNDTIPMETYRVVEPPSANGFSLSHSPYQQTTAQASPKSRTTRTFLPPTTVAVSSLPFFKTKMWFVPAANAYETNVLSFFKVPQLRLVRWMRWFPRLQRCIDDAMHTRQYLSDMNYRFLSQDRITMQGQD